MGMDFLRELARYGKEHCERLSEPDARAWCERLVWRHYENFSVLSRLVPADLRGDFAAVYAFCRWSDDLGDEVGNREESLRLLSWWREELRACFSGQPRHPVFTALRPTVRRHMLPIEPFDRLIAAFEQDQRISRYRTWNQLIDYCTKSADPVGRLVLMICGEPRTEELFQLSDRICTALQLTNHWQDVKRDILDRDRIYIPAELISIEDFEDRLRPSASRGWAIDRTFLSESRELIRACVERTWPLYETGRPLLESVGRRTRPIVSLFMAGGQHILRQIMMWNYETVLHRPVLSRPAKALLLARAWWMSSRPGRPRAEIGVRTSRPPAAGTAAPPAEASS